MKPNGLRCQIALWLGIVLGTGFFVINPGRAQAQSYQYHSYWGLNGWVAQSYLPPTTLQISPVGESVRVEWPLSLSNALLQATTELNSTNGWRTVTEAPVVATSPDSRGVTLTTTNAQQFFRLSGTETAIIPIFSFAAFVDGQMELTWTATLTFRGRVHANGPICLGPPASSSLSFNGTVTTASFIVKSNLGGYLASNMTGPVTYLGTPKYRTYTPQLKLCGAETYAREIVEPPPLGELATSPLGQQRYYNKAAVVLLVSNTSVTITVKNLGESEGISTNLAYNSSAPSLVEQTNLTHFLPFLSLTNTFTDYRESKRVKATQINMAVLNNWLFTNSMVLAYYPSSDSPPYPGLMYVGDFRTQSTNLYAVRVMNAAIIPTNGPTHLQASGFTLATPNPLYVWGHYNCPNPTHLETTNTTEVFPASLVADAITILSHNWQDSTYGTTTPLSSRTATNTTVNAAFIAGTVYSTDSAIGQWSGGLHNLPRLLEDWNSRTLTINGSLVNLYASAKATTQFRNPGVYYYAPTRNFHFNQNFNSPHRLPPGTPTVVGTTPLD